MLTNAVMNTPPSAWNTLAHKVASPVLMELGDNHIKFFEVKDVITSGTKETGYLNSVDKV